MQATNLKELMFQHNQKRSNSPVSYYVTTVYNQTAPTFTVQHYPNVTHLVGTYPPSSMTLYYEDIIKLISYVNEIYIACGFILKFQNSCESTVTVTHYRYSQKYVLFLSLPAGSSGASKVVVVFKPRCFKTQCILPFALSM